MKKVKITLVRSTIDTPHDQKATANALGLRKLNRTVEKEYAPQIAGMVNKIKHLVTVQEI